MEQMVPTIFHPKNIFMIFSTRLLASSKNRIIGLDILRSIAIILVMYEHGDTPLPGKLLKYVTLPRPSIDGVSIFFVLSGFLIGGILLKIISTSHFTSKDLLNFWIRRWLRTIPNYYFILFIMLGVHYLISRDIGQFNYKYFLFSQNLYQPHPLFFPEAWSLSIEEWFYLLFPISTYLLFKTLKDKNKSVLIAATIFLILPLGLRIIKYYSQGEIPAGWDLDFRKIIVLRLDSLMYGVIGAYLYRYKTAFWNRIKYPGLLLSGAIIIFLITYSALTVEKPMFLTIYHFNLESIAVLFALPYFSELKTIPFKKIASFCTIISLLSYSMYLINLTLIQDIAVPYIISVIGLSHGTSHFLNTVAFFLQYFLFWFLTISISYYLYFFIELPFMNLRNHIQFNKRPERIKCEVAEVVK